MHRITQYSFLVVILCFSTEVAFKLKYHQDKLFFPSNATTPTEKYIALWDSLSSSANAEMLNSKRLFLIGDSFLMQKNMEERKVMFPISHSLV